MTQIALPRDDLGLDEIRTGSPWLAFTGLLPVIVMVPILLAHAYALGVIVAAVGCVAVVGYHLARRQGVTSLDGAALAFAAVNLALYFGLGNTWLIHHIAAVFYTLLGAQCIASLLRGEPWTAQFTRRTVRPEFVADPRFTAMNRRATRIWALAFVGCDAIALTVSGATGDWLPVVVMVAAAVVSRRAARRLLSSG